MDKLRSIAIVGAGIAGLGCAQQLQARGLSVRLFDKGRGPGGRMSTRRADYDGTSYRFDHGAQYFTARHPLFKACVAQWQQAGAAQQWPPQYPDAWVGTPAMNAPVRHLAAQLPVQFGSRIDRVERLSNGYVLDGEGTSDAVYDSVIIAVPAEQAGALLAPIDAQMANLAQSVKSAPCWTVMCAFAAPLAAQADFIRDCGPIGWAARNNAKPWRGAEECWVIQASASWSADHLEDEAQDVSQILTQEFARAVGAELPPILVQQTHRWRYALAHAAERDFAWNSDSNVGACGDWLRGARVEDAWLSGRLLADAVLASGHEA